MFIKKEHIVENEIETDEYTNHTIIIGFGEFGQNVAKVLKNDSFPYIAIENNIDTYHKVKALNEPVIFGNAVKKDILKTVNIKMAKNIVIAIDNPKKLYHVCHTLQHFLSNENIIVKVHNSGEKQTIEELGIMNIIVENEVSSQEVLKKLI